MQLGEEEDDFEFEDIKYGKTVGSNSLQSTLQKAFLLGGG